MELDWKPGKFLMSGPDLICSTHVQPTRRILADAFAARASGGIIPVPVEESDGL